MGTEHVEISLAVRFAESGKKQAWKGGGGCTGACCKSLSFNLYVHLYISINKILGGQGGGETKGHPKTASCERHLVVVSFQSCLGIQEAVERGQSSEPDPGPPSADSLRRLGEDQSRRPGSAFHRCARGTQFPAPWDEACLGLTVPLPKRRLGELSVNESETHGLSFSAHMRA